MSAATNCACPCPTPEIVTVPGSAGSDGAAGAAGTNGVNAYTLTTADITLPAAAGAVAVASSFAVASWMAIGQIIFISDGTNYAHFRVLTVPSSISATLYWLKYPGDAVGTTVIASGAKASPAGVFSLPAALPTAITYTGISAAPVSAVNSLNVQAGVGMSTITIPHTWIGGTGAVNPVTTMVIPFKFRIVSWLWVTEVLLVGAGGTRAANLAVGGVDVTGGVVTVVIASAAVGSVIAQGSAISAGNTGAAGGNISVELAGAGTEFTAGSGTFQITIQNMDTADAIAHLCDGVNDLITALT